MPTSPSAVDGGSRFPNRSGLSGRNSGQHHGEGMDYGQTLGFRWNRHVSSANIDNPRFSCSKNSPARLRLRCHVCDFDRPSQRAQIPVDSGDTGRSPPRFPLTGVHTLVIDNHSVASGTVADGAVRSFEILRALPRNSISGRVERDRNSLKALTLTALFLQMTCCCGSVVFQGIPERLRWPSFVTSASRGCLEDSTEHHDTSARCGANVDGYAVS